jgi:hypothetical protein
MWKRFVMVLLLGAFAASSVPVLATGPDAARDKRVAQHAKKKALKKKKKKQEVKPTKRVVKIKKQAAKKPEAKRS